MNFKAFKDSISSPAIRQVAIHWNEARRSGLMPAWSDIRPAAMAEQLPIIWSYRFDRDRKEFTARLAGDHIEQIFGKSFRKLSLGDAHSEGSFSWAHALLERVVTEPALHRSYGRVFKHLGRSGYGERIALPLSADGVVSDGILGATEYHYFRPAAGALVESDDSETWYSLRPERALSR
ncbi:MAG: PAS domain-containing protein [Alphaproteobacteria bacterium]|nr:PAS domain-containing protein [Alphaproteobacteria bacterium]